MSAVDWKSLRRSALGDEPESVLPKRVRLPVLPLAVVKFSRASEQPGASPRELGKIIEADSGLTCELLRYVNSSALGVSQKASSVQQAIGLLGIRESRLYLLTVAVQRAMRHHEWKVVNARDFWAVNLERALVAQELARLLKADTDTAFAAGMLVDFLLPALTNGFEIQYRRFVHGESEEGLSLPRYEKKVLGWDHGEAAARVMAEWAFPDELVCCTLLHHRGLSLLDDPMLGDSAAAAVAVASLIPDPFSQVPRGLDRLKELDEKWRTFDLQAIAERVHEEFQERCPGTGNSYALLRHCRRISGAPA